MIEENGSRDSRLDRIERALEMFVADHEQFRQDHKPLLTAQVVQQAEIKDLVKIVQAHTAQLQEQGRHLRELGEGVNERIDKLVSGIGEFIRGLDRS